MLDVQAKCPFTLLKASSDTGQNWLKEGLRAGVHLSPCHHTTEEFKNSNSSPGHPSYYKDISVKVGG